MEHREGGLDSNVSQPLEQACPWPACPDDPLICPLDYVSLKVQPFLTKLAYLTNRSGKLF
jgi:hypothetical protein